MVPDSATDNVAGTTASVTNTQLDLSPVDWCRLVDTSWPFPCYPIISIPPAFKHSPGSSLCSLSAEEST
jgi:hypothetical protein